MELKSIEIGRRLKRFRTALGWTQEQLAEKANTSAQNISKYEKQGLTDINTIVQLSSILGQDLQSDEKDVEGSVGEIGMEILMTLIRKQGDACPEDLRNYGLSDSDITHELFKLQRLGLVIHDQYVDFDGRNRNIVFITAKGIITCKNSVTNPLLSDDIKDCLPKVKSIEQRFERPHGIDIGDVYSMSEYIEKRPEVKLIKELPITNYRPNYCIWLKREFLKYDPSCGSKYEDYSEKELFLFPGKYFSFDVIHSMVMGLNHENKIDLIRKYFNPEFGKKSEPEPEDPQYPREEYNIMDAAEASYGGPYLDFCDYYPWIREHFYDEPDEETIEILQQNEYEREQEDLEDKKKIKRRKSFKAHMRKQYDYYRQKSNSKFPDDFFSPEEIKEYLQKNLIKPENEGFKKIDDMIKEINRIRPETKEYYFVYSWKKCGIEEYVKDFYDL